MNLSKELETAITLARQAGAVIMDFYASGVATESKISFDNFSEPVTIADKTSSRLIVEGLAQNFPKDAILSEEEPDQPEIRLSKPRVWMIDPLDGTKGFIDKNGDFAVQIGLTENGESILGVVFMPTENALYFAEKGTGTFLVENDQAPQRLQVSDKTDLAQMTLATSRDHHSPRMSEIVETLGLKQEIQRGSVGLKIGLITRQLCDLYIHLSPYTKYWDSCAPQIILEEAGGKMTDIFGDSLRYDLKSVQNHNGILASNGIAHTTAVEQFKPLLNKFGRFRIKR